MELLSIKGLKKRFGAVEVLKGIDLTIPKGETLVILGSSGSGKSTMLRCINFLEIPDEGEIHLNSRRIGSVAHGKIVYTARELNRVRAEVGMVFQQFNLFPHLSIEGNVMLGLLKVRGKNKTDARRIALASLERVGLRNKAEFYPSALSGGQQQRVAIARALAMQPAMILFDEPTSALDPELVGEVLQTMRKLAEDGTTMAVVTHELGFAYNVARRVVFLHDGCIHEQGSPQEVLMRPKTARMREFLESHSQFRIPETAMHE